MKIYDSFTFFNELDLVELRFALLNDYVDHFVVVESNKTHTYKKKPHFFEREWQRWEPYHSKIIHIKFDPEASGIIPDISHLTRGDCWRMENAQRNAIATGLIHAHNDDLILVGDVDEIPTREFMAYLRANGRTLKEPTSLRQQLHFYYLNCQAMDDHAVWKGTVVAKRGRFPEHGKHYPQDMRNGLQTYPGFVNAGWHFSYLGNAETIRTKLGSFAHTEYQTEEYMNIAKINARINGYRDPFGNAKLKIMPLDAYPDYFIKLAKAYPHLIAQESTL